MGKLEFWHRIHGDKLHDLVIFLVERYVVSHGGHLMDITAFKKRHLWPCEPDVVFWWEKKGIRYVYVVEIESHATKASVNRKSEQYLMSLKGVTDMILIDLKLLASEPFTAVDEEKLVDYDWHDLESFIEERMPL